MDHRCEYCRGGSGEPCVCKRNLRSEARKGLEIWYKKEILGPFVAKGREMGLSNEEINVAFNAVMQQIHGEMSIPRPYVGWSGGPVMRDGSAADPDKYGVFVIDAIY